MTPSHAKTLQEAFIAACLDETGALTDVNVVSYVLSKSGLDREPEVAQEYLDSLKMVRGAAEFETLVPAMKKALKTSGDKLKW